MTPTTFALLLIIDQLLSAASFWVRIPQFPRGGTKRRQAVLVAEVVSLAWIPAISMTLFIGFLLPQMLSASNRQIPDYYMPLALTLATTFSLLVGVFFGLQLVLTFRALKSRHVS